MIAHLAAHVFDRIGHFWTVSGNFLIPDEEDVQTVLDEAAKKLYTYGVGDRLETGGLIIEKTEHGHDVYCYLGNYQ